MGRGQARRAVPPQSYNPLVIIKMPTWNHSHSTTDCGKKFGEECVMKYREMFNSNTTLTKISWRLESRQSFALNKCITRNSDIQRRLEAGRDVSDILPDRHRDLAPTKVDANSGYLTWSEAKQQRGFCFLSSLLTVSDILQTEVQQQQCRTFRPPKRQNLEL